METAIPYFRLILCYNIASAAVFIKAMRTKKG
jgi:hypothetical protein